MPGRPAGAGTPQAASTVGMMSMALASASLEPGGIVPGWRSMMGVRKPPS